MVSSKRQHSGNIALNPHPRRSPRKRRFSSPAKRDVASLTKKVTWDPKIPESTTPVLNAIGVSNDEERDIEDVEMIEDKTAGEGELTGTFGNANQTEGWDDDRGRSSSPEQPALGSFIGRSPYYFAAHRPIDFQATGNSVDDDNQFLSSINIDTEDFVNPRPGTTNTRPLPRKPNTDNPKTDIPPRPSPRPNPANDPPEFRSQRPPTNVTDYSLPWNMFAPAYQCPALLPTTDLDGKAVPSIFKRIVFEHLNCSYFSHPGQKAPTLEELKQHAQSLVALIAQLQIPGSKYRKNPESARNEETFTQTTPPVSPFDFLESFDEKYKNESWDHQIPLQAFVNRIRPVTTRQRNIEYQEMGCPLHQSALNPSGVRRPVPRDPSDPSSERILNPDLCIDPGNPLSWPSEHLARLMLHANEALTLVDHAYAESGGLLSTVPDPSKRPQNFATSGILPQMLLYLTQLSTRVADLEVQIAAAQDALKNDAFAPWASQSLLPSQRPLLFPQDNYVLTGLTVPLHQHLSGLLKNEQERLETHEREVHKATRHDTPHRNAIPCIELPCRFYQLPHIGSPGDKTIFILPLGIEPKTGKEANSIKNNLSTAFLSRSLIQTVPTPTTMDLSDIEYGGKRGEQATYQTALQRKDLGEIEDQREVEARLKKSERARMQLKILLAQERKHLRQVLIGEEVKNDEIKKLGVEINGLKVELRRAQGKSDYV
ncbi:MAG: hypothetical protein M1834_001499 [Cirrosporium novae-zelandiae]|nr:MAG: hypothetical protein M1834_004016 [Cirrosporium novae-zelandiae]KAI9735485.1 MAG: hypothetical protein M1834_001499 [Cirrosporium novae-zelandiae]